MAVNINDERFTEVENDKKAALSEIEQAYSGAIDESQKYYQAQIDASKEWAETQSRLQQEKTDFAIEQIEQQKEQTEKDYKREQSGAYVDWQKESNKYGTGAEQMAASGLANSGYSESAQVSMYNTYQNRVAAARESYNKAVLNYDNAIKDARLQNNSKLAEIAYNALQEQLALSLEGFQFKNALVLEKANKKVEIDNTYHSRYQDVLDQINYEQKLEEEIGKYTFGDGDGTSDAPIVTNNIAQETWSNNDGEGGSAQNWGKPSESSYEKPIYRVSQTMGNSASTQKSSDYYFSNGYQPSYIDNTKLVPTGLTIAHIGADYGVPETEPLWEANGRIYVWDDKTREYMYICKA